MDQRTQLLILIVAAVVAIAAAYVTLRRQRRDREARGRENQYATSTEGQKRCPSCGMFNQWTDRTCISCGGPLKG